VKCGRRKSVGRSEWPCGLFNLSFDDDSGCLSLLFPPGVDAPSATPSDGSSSKDSGNSCASEPANERSRLAVSPAASYDGRGSSQQLVDVPRTPDPIRDTRPLIPDDDERTGGGQESAVRIVGEVWLPFLLAGLGSVFAGLVLDLVQVRT